MEKCSDFQCFLFSGLYLLVWEERENTTPMNNENSPSNVTTDSTTNVTPKHSEKNECGDMWTRSCPDCGRVISYTTRQGKWLGNKLNSRCSTCVRSDPTVREKLRLASLGENNPFFGKHHSSTTKEILSKKCAPPSGSKNHFYGKKHTKEACDSIRESRVGIKLPPRTREWRDNLSKALTGKAKSKEHKKRIGENSALRIIHAKRCAGILKIGYNKKACKIIDEYSEKLNTVFQHAENGGEVWFGRNPVDGYSAEKNIVIEVDEMHHFKDGNLKPADVDRMSTIKRRTGCKFIRIRYNKDGSYHEYLNEWS